MEHAAPMTRGKLLFLVTEDWFFRSHFMPMLRRAQAEGFDVVIAARLSGALSAEELAGARLIDAPFARGSLRLGDIQRDARFIRDLIAREKPQVVHAIALKPIALLIFSRARVPRILAVTGRGYIAVSRMLWSRAVSWLLSRLIRANLNDANAVLAVENVADRAWVERGSALPNARVVLFPGAGVEAEHFTPSPEPPEPIVVGVVARLIFSKGIDIAVEAVRQLRDAGADIRLHIAGAPDAENPEHVSVVEIDRWRATAGVTLLGRVEDVNGFWAGAHIACLPSRGGEGLPRSLLEAAACGRAIATSDAPGCSDFVVDGETGFVVSADNAGALAAVIHKLATDAALRQRMGAAGRARVLAGYTTQHVAECTAEAWRQAKRASAGHAKPVPDQ